MTLPLSAFAPTCVYLQRIGLLFVTNIFEPAGTGLKTVADYDESSLAHQSSGVTRATLENPP